jgi:hypothetical protein
MGDRMGDRMGDLMVVGISGCFEATATEACHHSADAVEAQLGHFEIWHTDEGTAI